MANRYTRRLQKKKNPKQFSLDDVQKSLAIAIEMKKLTKGHLFMKNTTAQTKDGEVDASKSYCAVCGANMKTKTQCDYWAMTLFDRLQSILINPSFYTDDNIEALWLQHGEEYQNIKLPLVLGAKEPDVKA